MGCAQQWEITGMNDAAPMESFPALEALRGLVRHGFVQRISGVDVQADNAGVLNGLHEAHLEAVEQLGFDPEKWFTAEQVHGAEVARVPQSGLRYIPGVDGLMTNQRGVMLGIHVADCGAIYLVDPGHEAIALLHSGKVGTQLGIIKVALVAMSQQFGTRAQDVIVQLGPCIRKPAYEVDFPAQIHLDALAAGVPPHQYFDCGTCTHAAPDRYYSYRREKGKTGRLLALLGMP